MCNNTITKDPNSLFVRIKYTYIWQRGFMLTLVTSLHPVYRVENG